jgi:hypothetical protein
MFSSIMPFITDGALMSIPSGFERKRRIKGSDLYWVAKILAN